MRTSQRQLSLIDELIDWELLEQQLGHHFSHKAAPPFRLMIGLLYLKTINDLSYEETVKNWGQSPDWQDFCGGLAKRSVTGTSRIAILLICDQSGVFHVIYSILNYSVSTTR